MSADDNVDINVECVQTQACNCPLKKKEDNFQRHNASAERVSRNATRHDTHNGTLETLEVFYALRCIVSILHDCSCTLLLPGILG